VHRDVVPPRANLHRDKLLDLLVPPSSAGNRRRRAVLCHNLQGDLTSNEVDLYVSAVSLEPFESVEAFVKDWAIETAAALLPCGHRVFARHRWMTGMATLEGPSLIANTQNLLARAIPRWLVALGKSKGTTSDAQPEPEQQCMDIVLWEERPAASLPKDQKTAWSEAHEKARGDAGRLAEMRHAVPLLLLCCCLRPLVRLMVRRFCRVGPYSGSRCNPGPPEEVSYSARVHRRIYSFFFRFRQPSDSRRQR
jgi:hypothetical protein